jgi:hypothetical protein
MTVQAQDAALLRFSFGVNLVITLINSIYVNTKVKPLWNGSGFRKLILKRIPQGRNSLGPSFLLNNGPWALR